MFQIGLFTTHLPYILIIAFYAAAVLFPPQHEEAASRDNKNTREHSCLVSCDNYPLYLKETSCQIHEKTNHWIAEVFNGIPGKIVFTCPISPTEFKVSEENNNDFARTFLSKNIPNRAPPAGILLSVA